MLIEWMKDRRNLLVFVAGPTGSGKSTLVSNMAYYNGMVGVHPGRAVRQNPRMIEILSKEDNPSAPRATEDFIKQHILHRIDKSGNLSVIVDGVPRNLNQVTWCVDTAMNYERELVFVSVLVPYHVRVDRLSKRGQVGDKQLLHKKLEVDEKILPPIIERAKEVVMNGRFGYFFEVYNRRNDDKLVGGIDGLFGRVI